MSSDGAIRTKLMIVGCADRRSSAPERGLVKAGLVLAGLHSRRPAAFVTGIVDFATDDPDGPIIASVIGSDTIACALVAPSAGACPVSPGPPSSKMSRPRGDPSIPPASLAS